MSWLNPLVEVEFYPSAPKFPGEVIKIPITTDSRFLIRTKSRRANGNIEIGADGTLSFHNHQARVGLGVGREAAFDFVMPVEGGDENADSKGRRSFLIEVGGVAGVWPQLSTDRILYRGRLHSRLEVSHTDVSEEL